jgi:cytochrome P450
LANLESEHMDPKTWGDPDCFRPERFLDKTGDLVCTENVIPFSLGKRSCLGEQLARQEIFLFLSRLLQQFQFLPPDGVTLLSEESFITGSATNTARGYRVRFVNRLDTKVQ